MRVILKFFGTVAIAVGAGLGSLIFMDKNLPHSKGLLGVVIFTGFSIAGAVGLMLMRKGPLQISASRPSRHDETVPQHEA